MKTLAQSLITSNDFDELWADVEYVERLPQGGDLYTYPDGSQLYINQLGSFLVK